MTHILLFSLNTKTEGRRWDPELLRRWSAGRRVNPPLQLRINNAQKKMDEDMKTSMAVVRPEMYHFETSGADFQTY